MPTLFQPTTTRQSPPTDRDRQIFKLAEIDRWTHEKIAQHIGRITRRRVSQIVNDVRLWLANHPADDPALKTELERKRLAQNLDRLRLENVIDRAVTALNQSPASLAVTCSTEGGPTLRYVRDQPPVDVRLLKTYLRAVEALARLNDRPEIPCPPPPKRGWFDPKIQNVIEFWKEKAELHHLKGDYIEMYAQELGHAFLAALNLDEEPAPAANVRVPVGGEANHSQQETTSSASQISQEEAPNPIQNLAGAHNQTHCQTETCDEPSASQTVSPTSDPPPEKIEKGSAANISDEERDEFERDLQGLKTIEQRLDTLLAQTPSSERGKRNSLRQSLTHVRSQKAAIELRLSPNTPGAPITTDNPRLNPQTTRS